MTDEEYEKAVSRYHIGITTCKGRTNSLTILLLTLATAKCSVPIDILYNDIAENDEIFVPDAWRELPLDINMYFPSNGQQSICKCRNYLSSLRQEKDYIILCDDDMFFMVHSLKPFVETNVKYEVIRGWLPGIISISKKALAQVGWHDERYDYGCEDVDFAHRLNMAGIKTFAFPEFEVATHLHSSVNNFEHQHSRKFHKEKWGADAEPEISATVPLIPDVDPYPELTAKYLKKSTLKEEAEAALKVKIDDDPVELGKECSHIVLPKIKKG